MIIMIWTHDNNHMAKMSISPIPTVPCHTVLYHTVLYHTVLYHAMLYCTMLKLLGINALIDMIIVVEYYLSYSVPVGRIQVPLLCAPYCIIVIFMVYIYIFF